MYSIKGKNSFPVLASVTGSESVIGDLLLEISLYCIMTDNTHTYTHTHTHKHIHVHTYTHTGTHKHVHRHIHTNSTI